MTNYAHLTDDRPDGRYVTIFDRRQGITTAWITSDVAVSRREWV